MVPWLTRVVFVLIGCGYLFIVPPFQVPDEYMHFGRTLAIADGHWRAERQQQRMGYRIPCSGAWLMEKMPRSVEFRIEGKYAWAEFWRLSAEAQAKGGDCFWEIDRGSLQLHVPILYAPQIAGVLFAKTITSQPAFWLYSARAANLLFALVIIFWLLRINPAENLRLLTLVTLPMTFHILASASGDALLIAISLAYYCYLLDALRAQQFSMRKSWPLAISAILFGLAKSVYFPLLLLLGLVVHRQKSRTAFAGMFVVFASAFCLLLVWNYLVRNDYYSTAIYGMDPAQQVRHILENPIISTVAVLRGYVDNAAKIAVTFFGVFGWLSVIMPLIWYLAYFTLAVGILCVTAADLRALSVPRWPFMLLAILTMLLLSLVMYVTFTPVAYSYTKGLQGRHLLPILPFLLAAVPGLTRMQRFLMHARPAALLAIFVLHLIALWHIYTRFY